MKRDFIGFWKISRVFFLGFFGLMLGQISWLSAKPQEECIRQVVAIGGSSFNFEPHNLAIDRFILSLVSTGKTPRVGFVGVAWNDRASEIDAFHKTYRSLGAETKAFISEAATREEFRAFLNSIDVLFVGGGTTKTMIDFWRANKFDLEIQEAYEAGTILAGVSAGGMCWFNQGVTDGGNSSAAAKMGGLACLGIIPGSFTPHYEWQTARQEFLAAALPKNAIEDGYAADDHTALHFVNGELKLAVSSHPEKLVRSVRGVDGQAQINPIHVQFLADPNEIRVRAISEADLERAQAFVRERSASAQADFPALFAKENLYNVVFAYQGDELIGVGEIRPEENKRALFSLVTIEDERIFETKRKLRETAQTKSVIFGLTLFYSNIQ